MGWRGASFPYTGEALGGLPGKIKFDEKGLIPAIIQDAATNAVLMLAYMNGESLAKTVETGYTWFWSRSRQELWNKGASSGHVQKVVSIDYDCDADILLVKVEQKGAACHTGNYSCFSYPLWNSGVLRPSIEDIAYAIAEKDKARIIPSGLTALNKLGLSTQVTMNAVYLTDATARELTIGNRKIIFKRSVPRNFAYKTDLFPLIVAAMKELGKDNVTDEQVAIIKQAIEKYGSPDEIKYDYSIAPQWIKQRLAL